MNVQLAARFRDVEVILEEFVYRFKRVLVKSFKRIFLEDLIEEHFAERCGQLIYYTADTEIFIAYDRLFRVEDSADIDRDLGFLIAVGKLAQVTRGRSDADDAFYLKLVAQNGLDALGNGFHLGAVIAAGKLFYNDDIGLVYADDEVMLLIGEKRLQDLDARNVRALDLTHEQQRTRNIRGKMQLLCSYINVAGKNVIGNYILKKSSLIVLFLVIHLRLVKGDGSHHARHARHIVAALNKNGIVKLAAVIAEHLIGTHAAYKHRLRKVVIHARKIIKP